jgi:hypothetical protein
VGPVVILLTLATASLLPQRYDTLAVRDGVRNSLFRDTVRRSPGFHFPGDLSTDNADLAEKLVAGSVQPVKVLFGCHGFSAIEPHYRRDRNLDTAVVTSQTVNLANHGPCPITVRTVYPAARRPKRDRRRQPWYEFRAPEVLIFTFLQPLRLVLCQSYGGASR